MPLISLSLISETHLNIVVFVGSEVDVNFDLLLYLVNNPRMVAHLYTIFKGKMSTLRMFTHVVVIVIVTSEFIHISEDFVLGKVISPLITSILFLSLFPTDVTEVMCCLIVLVRLVSIIEDLIRTKDA